MRIEAVDLIQIRIPLVGWFEISRGGFGERNILLVRVHSEGASGWGEAGADRLPLYTYETAGTCRHIIAELLAPEIFELDLPEVGAASAVADHMTKWPWHPMAKAALEEAVWDLEARRRDLPVHRLYAGDRPVRDRVMVGISLGIQKDFEVLAEQIDTALAQGYRRVKLKIAKGRDIDVVEAVRNRFGDIPLMVDANCAYRREDMSRVVELDRFGMEMIEQPFEYDELELHAELQAQIATPICLDESAKTVEVTERALQAQAARIINIKCSRLGGRSAGIAVHDLCEQRQIPVWCGGMLESGVGRLHNIAVAALPNFTMSNDLSASRRYWEQDIIDPEVELDGDGHVRVPQGPGIGHDVCESRLERYLVERRTLRA